MLNIVNPICRLIRPLFINEFDEKFGILVMISQKQSIFSRLSVFTEGFYFLKQLNLVLNCQQ
jgi:hypothetical protein